MRTQNRKNSVRTRLGTLLLSAALGATACDLDLKNPNAPSEDEVLASPALLLTTAVGIQNQYAENLNVFLRAPGLVTDEWGTRPRALAADVSLVTGNTIDPAFGVVSDPFAAAYRVARTADLLVSSLTDVELGTGLETGIGALARTLKAMAIGNLTTQYQRLPANHGPAAAPLPRDEVRDTVIALLEQARADLATVTDADLSTFRARVLGTGFDLRNTVNAMLARYYLFDGRYAAALEAANRVNLAVISTLVYPDPSVNPVFNYSSQLQYTGARRVFFTEAEAGDRRPAFWADRSSGVLGNPPTVLDSVFDFRAYGGSRNDPYPLYLPDEIRLIQAEVYARQNNFAQARELINAVRTQCSSALNEPVACLPALPVAALDTQEEVLAQILYERRYELFGQGVRWEDLRRLRSVTSKRPSVEFLPYPQSECDRNPANPC